MLLSLESLSHLADEETEADVYTFKEVWKEWQLPPMAKLLWVLLFLPPVSYACIFTNPVPIKSLIRFLSSFLCLPG